MNSKIIDKIKKLLALAADNPDSPESQSAGEKAAALMAKHNIGCEEIKIGDDEHNQNQIKEEEIRTTAKAHSEWENLLGGLLARIFDCDRYSTTYNKDLKTRTFIGTPSDLALLTWYYKYIRLRVAKKAEEMFTTIRDKNEFGMSAIMALRPRFEEMYKQKTEESDGALVVVKKDAVTKYMKKTHGDLKRVAPKSRQRGGVEARNAGAEFGSKLSLNQQVEG